MNKRLFERPDKYFQFRAWDKKEKKMYYLDSSARISDLWTNYKVPMMFTGRYVDTTPELWRAKNKLLYEGDILRRLDNNILGIVKYNVEKLMFELIWVFDSYTVIDNFGIIPFKLIKVGNVFENGKELFKDIVGWQNIFTE